MADTEETPPGSSIIAIASDHHFDVVTAHGRCAILLWMNLCIGKDPLFDKFEELERVFGPDQLTLATLDCSDPHMMQRFNPARLPTVVLLLEGGEVGRTLSSDENLEGLVRGTFRLSDKTPVPPPS